jgi:AcrR family transcriptional regulator
VLDIRTDFVRTSDVMQSPRGAARRGPRARRAAILDAAARRYQRFGPRRTTMDDVAREARCARATVYAHFGGKEGLYAGLLERETSAFLREIEACAAAGRGARPKLRRIVEATCRVYADNPVLRGAVTRDGEMTLEAVARDVMRAHEREVIAVLRRVLEEGIAEGSLRPVDSEAVAYLMYQLGTVLVTREVAGHGDYAFEKILRVMDDLVSRGIARPGGPAGRRR